MNDPRLSDSPSTLAAPVRDAILIALDDEYHAEAVYAATLDKFGADVRPFCNIINAERRHQAALFKLMETYNIPVPANAYLTGDKPFEAIPDTLQEACEIGVAAEIENARLYDEDLLPAVVDYEDITRVFKALSGASTNNHLPAFERCAARGAQPGGNGGGQGQRQGRKMAGATQNKGT